MNFKNYDYSSADANSTNCEILSDAISVQINDQNLKPYWVEHPALHTEFFVKRNKKNLLLVIGESWTYGETLPGIATGIQQYNFLTQLTLGFSAKMAVTLDTDLYQYAVPGNCNFYMFSELDRILSYVSNLQYETIYVCMQMTEPSREQSLIKELEKNNHPLQDLIFPKQKMTFTEWLTKYDNIFFDEYEKIISKYKNLNCILWKNFCSVNTESVNRTFNIINTTWIEYSSKVLSADIVSPTFYSAGWLDTIVKDYQQIKFDRSELLRQLDLIEASNAFIKANSLHSHHPNQFGHLLWSQFLLRKAGWVNDI
jgi:hypothetical protein